VQLVKVRLAAVSLSLATALGLILLHETGSKVRLAAVSSSLATALGLILLHETGSSTIQQQHITAAHNSSSTLQQQHI
jgi:hypothetical protein